MIGNAELHKAVQDLWNSEGLDTEFSDLWNTATHNVDEYQVLSDGEPAPGSPHPYCVIEQSPGVTLTRMSAATATKMEERDVPWQFRVHAKSVSGDNRDAKKIAADLAEEIMKVFGGHPTVNPTKPTLSSTTGNFLQSQYQTDWGLREGDDEWLWIVSYLFKLDMRVTAPA